jgi:hypothetical protein
LSDPAQGSEATGFRVARIVPDGDPDEDEIPDSIDKCMFDFRNGPPISADCDSDCDGYGNVFDPDYDQNFATNATDFSTYFISAFKGLDPAPRAPARRAAAAVAREVRSPAQGAVTGADAEDSTGASRTCHEPPSAL